MTNKKSHTSFRLVPKSVTLNDLEHRNGRNICVISSNSVAFVTDYIKWLKIDRQKCRPKNLVFSDMSYMAILGGNHPQRER